MHGDFLQANQKQSKVGSIVDDNIQKCNFLGSGGNCTARSLICPLWIVGFNLFANSPVTGGTGTTKGTRSATDRPTKCRSGRPETRCSSVHAR